MCERAEERLRAQPRVAALSVVYLRDVNAGAGRVTETRSGTRESERVRRMQKEAYKEEERARARESEQSTIKDMAKKEFDAEKQKRLLADKCK